METLSTYPVEETSHMRSEEEEVEEEEEDDGEEKIVDSCTDESAVQKQQGAAWAPRFFYILNKEVYYYVGQQIIIEEALDSYGGMIWPAALALSKYLESHSEQLSLVDKAVLELGAGVGLVSIVAALLGAWVTATDLSDVLNNLRVNLSRNTRGRCRHTPQVAPLFWGYDLKDTYPTSVYHYDYVLATDVVYHHDFLDELLATMKHFCQPGTTLIWANKIRMVNDVTFAENFKKAFHTSLLFDDGDMRIYKATCKEEEAVADVGLENQGLLGKEEEEDDKEKLEEEKQREVEQKEEKDGGGGEKKYCSDKLIANKDVAEEACSEKSGAQEGSEEDESGDEDDEDDGIDKPDSVCDRNVTGQVQIQQTAAQPNRVSDLKPGTFSSFNKDIYHYAGQDIVICESIDSFGAVMWPAALALCSFLDSNRQRVNLKDKEVLELGAGTGLVSIVASLLGASVTATDLRDVLGNLRANVMRNTRGRCRHTPQVEVLSWDYDLKHSHPTSVHHYDYVLAADVVYHHDFLGELLATMKHFCQPGTTLIWANKIRMVNDVTFAGNFKKAFHTSLLFDDGDMKIFMGTCRQEEEEEGEGKDEETEKQNDAGPKEENDEDGQQYCKDKVIEKTDVAEEACGEGDERQESEDDDDDEDDENETDTTNSIDSCCKTTTGDDNATGQVQIQQTAAQPNRVSDFKPGTFNSFDKDIYHYAGQDIVIRESIDSFGAVMWPAALALCSFLDSNRQRVNLKDKEVLELGAGTGLVSIVASLLGASVTATDLRDVLGNLRANVMRNTRGRCRHTPQVEVLSWDYDLKHSHPTSVHHYDYVLAADVVYHHDFLGELLATMKHFCQPGTTLIWANKIRMVNDVTFAGNFKKAFHTSLLFDDGDMKIFMGTCRE